MPSSLYISIPTNYLLLPFHHYSSSSSHLSWEHHLPAAATHKLLINARKSQKLQNRFLGLRESGHILFKSHALATDSDFINPCNTNSGIMPHALFREMGLTEKQTESILSVFPALRFEPLESIRSRIHLLQFIGVSLRDLPRLILKRPAVLTSEEVGSFISLLRGGNLELEGKIKPSLIHRLLNSIEPRFLQGFEEKVRLLLQHGLPREKIAHVLNDVNIKKAFCLKSIEEIDNTLTFLNHFGGVDLILLRPAILNYDLDTQLIPRINFLLDLSNDDESATSMMLHRLPYIVAYSVDHFKAHVNFLMSFAGLSKQEVFDIARIHPNIFSASRKRKLHPRIDFLKQCGLNSHDIYRFLVKSPLFLSLSEENLAFKLVFLFKIGYTNNTKELAIALGSCTRTSCKNMQEVIGVYLYYGLTCDDIKEMSKKHPQILQYNHKSLEKKMYYLIEEMGREVGELLNFPAFLGYDLDSRIKHRYELKKEILGEGMSINKLLSVSAASFSTKNKKKRLEKAIDEPSGVDE